MMLRILSVGVCALLLLSGLTVGQADEKAVAKVNGEAISEAMFQQTLLARAADRVLNAMIANLIVRQAAKAAGVTVAADEVERRYVAAERLVELRAPMTGENFEMWLAKRQLTREYFRTELYHQMLLEKMVAGQVKVTAKDVSDFYSRNKDQLREPAMMRIAHICVETEKEAMQIKADIVAKKITWDEAAKKHSLDPWSKDSGGDLGFMAQTESDFHQAAFALKTNNDITEPIRSPMGVHLIKRLAYKEARTPPFEEIEASIRDQIEHAQISRLASQKRDELMKAAKVEVLLKAQNEPDIPGLVQPKAPEAAPKP